jgi:sugar phosphate isomerase/epimerase
MAPLMKRYGGEYLGVCIDWGNNIALLDDPMEVVEALAPFAVNSHIKDMALQEYEDGFLLSEVPLGQGILDLKRMLATIRKARPKVRFSLDMLTRNPLKVPCLTEKYWAPFPERNGKYLARTIRLVRANRPRKPLQYMDGLDREGQVRTETGNIAQSIAWARENLDR